MKKIGLALIISFILSVFIQEIASSFFAVLFILFIPSYIGSICLLDYYETKEELNKFIQQEGIEKYQKAIGLRK